LNLSSTEQIGRGAILFLGLAAGTSGVGAIIGGGLLQDFFNSSRGGTTPAFLSGSSSLYLTCPDDHHGGACTGVVQPAPAYREGDTRAALLAARLRNKAAPSLIPSAENKIHRSTKQAT
jgi:hypothetical protein